MEAEGGVGEPPPAAAGRHAHRQSSTADLEAEGSQRQLGGAPAHAATAAAAPGTLRRRRTSAHAEVDQGQSQATAAATLTAGSGTVAAGDGSAASGGEAAPGEGPAASRGGWRRLLLWGLPTLLAVVAIGLGLGLGLGLMPVQKAALYEEPSWTAQAGISVLYSADSGGTWQEVSGAAAVQIVPDTPTAVFLINSCNEAFYFDASIGVLRLVAGPNATATPAPARRRLQQETLDLSLSPPDRPEGVVAAVGKQGQPVWSLLSSRTAVQQYNAQINAWGTAVHSDVPLAGLAGEDGSGQLASLASDGQLLKLDAASATWQPTGASLDACQALFDTAGDLWFSKRAPAVAGGCAGLQICRGGKVYLVNGDDSVLHGLLVPVHTLVIDNTADGTSTTNAGSSSSYAVRGLTFTTGSSSTHVSKIRTGWSLTCSPCSFTWQLYNTNASGMPAGSLVAQESFTVTPASSGLAFYQFAISNPTAWATPANTRMAIVCNATGNLPVWIRGAASGVAPTTAGGFTVNVPVVISSGSWVQPNLYFYFLSLWVAA
ncbi:hypothetical protein ABPG75_001160 [Micractinium tetrahymenae]